MREVNVNEIINTVKELCIKANKVLPDDLADCIKCGLDNETKELPKSIMGDIVKNLDCAAELDIPICQDTGMAIVFAEIGQDVHIVGGGFEDAVNNFDTYMEKVEEVNKQLDTLRRDLPTPFGIATWHVTLVFDY